MSILGRDRSWWLKRARALQVAPPEDCVVVKVGYSYPHEAKVALYRTPQGRHGCRVWFHELSSSMSTGNEDEPHDLESVETAQQVIDEWLTTNVCRFSMAAWEPIIWEDA